MRSSTLLASGGSVLVFLLATGLGASACSGDASGSGGSSSSSTSSSSATTATSTGMGGQGGATSTASAGGGGSGGSVPVGAQPDCTPPNGAIPPLKLTQIATGLVQPVLVKAAPGDDHRLFVLEQAGRVRIIKDGELQPTPFLAIEPLVKNSGMTGDERGLLGLAFHPDYAQNGRFFLHYSDESKGGDTLIAEFHRGADLDVADPTPVASVLMQDQPESNHNGGAIEFGADGFLYIGLGDGGGAEDMHGTTGNGQDLGTLLGKILRIDVSAVPYTIPPGNMTGNGVRPEIWDYGMRNPWRFSFDACTGDLYIGDVGQYLWEEVDVEPKGQGNKNYGWRLMEGTHCFNPDTDCDPGNTTVLPVAEYDHVTGCSISGGYVYRGSAIPGLRGAYLYGDYCSGKVWTLTWANGAASAPVSLTGDLKTGGKSISSFGQDNAGEMYLVDLGGDVFRIDPE